MTHSFRKRTAGLAAVMAAAALLLTAGCSNESDRLEKQISLQQKQLDGLEQENGRLTAQLNEADGKLKSLTEHAEQLKAQAEQLVKEGEQELRIDKRLPPDAVAVILNLMRTAQTKPGAHAKEWDLYFADSDNIRWFIENVLEKQELNYAKLETGMDQTYKKPGKTNRMIVVNAYTPQDVIHAYALSNVNDTGWKIIDVD
ncbi:hypothetical protein [Paenibacillus montanisoli]|uniref:DUF4878 domain-containing protein n=1 Tax=Paenibacillus montanisoli TaxID=2081970 RepID=A0A328UCB2_9BACL|nr:hypothetical protein [Paenibacillus montanisoli]RAP77994.1 hypothetical protein DL346_05965 [Paenibacillus montanisoli]